jgi:hypothetical protein
MGQNGLHGSFHGNYYSVPAGSSAVVGVPSPTQGVIAYSAPSSGATCTVEVSESNTYAPVVIDVDPTLYTNANVDTSRANTLVDGVYRVVTVGQRFTDTTAALDGNKYSHALQNNTLYYYRLCGNITGTFTTMKIPTGVTYQDVPQLDPNTPGATALPTMLDTRAATYIDPHTGAKIWQMGIPSDIPYTPGNSATYGPFLYFGGFVPVCSDNIVGGNGGRLCGIPSGDGGTGILYYAITTGATPDFRYLGKDGWNAAYPYINPTDGKFYVLHNGVDLQQKVYNGTYAQATAGSVASFSSTTLLSGVPTAIHAFNAAFTAADFSCGDSGSDVGLVAIGDYVNLQCKRGTQDTYGWVAIVQISTGLVIAATRVDNNIQTRWCAIHELAPMYNRGDVNIQTHELVGQSPAIGGGPYISTLVGNISASATAMTIAGAASCAACGADSEQPVWTIGDYVKFTTGNQEIVQITNIVGANWTITATTKSHSNGDTVEGFCSASRPNGNNGYPIYWNYLSDPNGTDTTNTNYVSDSYFPNGGHDFMTTGIRGTEHWPLVLGDLVSSVNTPITRTIQESLFFAGVQAQCFGNGCVAHPSSGPVGGTKFYDNFKYDGAGNQNTMTSVLVSGQLYNYTYTPGLDTPDIKHYAQASVIQAYKSASGPFSFKDVSGPSSSIPTDATGNYQYCIANANDECVSGSIPGKVYINSPAVPNATCGVGFNSLCLTNFSTYANGTLQLDTSGTARVISGGLTSLRGFNDYPTARTLGDGSYTFVPLGDVQASQTLPARILAIKVPADWVSDGVDRTTFVRASLGTFATPSGMGISTATVEFGYQEFGNVTDYRATSRLETTLVQSNTVNDAVPFYYKTTDTYTKQSCAVSCAFTLPVLPLHTAYWQVKYYDAGGVFVVNGARGIAIEGSSYTLP